MRQRSTTGLGASIALHSLLVAGVVSATVSATTTVAPPLDQHIIYVPPDQSPPRATTPPVMAAPPAAAPGAMSVPVTMPDVLPVTEPPLPPATQLPTAAFLPGGWAVTAPPVPTPGSPYLVEQVEVAAAVAKGSPLPKFPSALRFAGVEGTARFQFVVDTLGGVELASVRELQATNDAFALAVRGTLPRMRFTPARVGGHAVRQLVEFPVVFRIAR